MRRPTYTRTRNFRTTPTLNQELDLLADRVNRHSSEIIREAIWSYVQYYRECPEKIVKVAR